MHAYEHTYIHTNQHTYIHNLCPCYRYKNVLEPDGYCGGIGIGGANQCLCPGVHIYVCIVKPDMHTIHMYIRMYVTPRADFIALWVTGQLNRNPTNWGPIGPKMVLFACEMFTICTLVSRF